MTIPILIPKEEELLVKTGQTIDFSTPLINKKATKEVTISLTSHLHIGSKKIFNVLKKFVGEKIKKGDIIAQHSGFLKHNKYISEYDGTIKEVNHHDGTITIESRTDTADAVMAYVKGEITEVDEKSNPDNIAIQIKVGKPIEVTAKETSGTFGGKVCYLDSESVQSKSEEEICDNIIMCKSIRSYHQTKLETLGAKGFISLHTLPAKTHTNYALIKEIPDWEKVMEHKLPYCTVDKEKSVIYFYE